MKPAGLKTKIFLDSGDPNETREIIKLLGFLDGQTTNPTLIAKNPDAQKRLQEGKKFTGDEVYGFYKTVVEEISRLIPDGSVSIEVYSDQNTGADTMFEQAKRMYGWIPNAHIKYPTTSAGLQSAENSVKAGMRVNMTLCFSQEQAAAVYAATRGAKKGQVFLSPFIGRLDDRGENGMDLIRNIIDMYTEGDGHVEVLTASVRSMDHFMCALQLGSDIITAPFKILQDWGRKGMPLPPGNYAYQRPDLKPVPKLSLDLGQQWSSYNIEHDLTATGIEKFSQDWNVLVA